VFRKLPVIVTALALVAAAAGCGGGESSSTLSKDEYQAKVVAAGQDLAKQFETISKEADTLSGSGVNSLDDASKLFEDLGDVVSRGEDELRAFADDLSSLSPPADAKDANEALAEGFGQLADAFGELGAALKDGSISDITQLAAKMQAIGTSDAGKTIQGAIDELEKAGYKFDAIG
jgi:ABC-type transporter Mla subunit MlaD